MLICLCLMFKTSGIIKCIDMCIDINNVYITVTWTFFQKSYIICFAFFHSPPSQVLRIVEKFCLYCRSFFCRCWYVTVDLWQQVWKPNITLGTLQECLSITYIFGGLEIFWRNFSAVLYVILLCIAFKFYFNNFWIIATDRETFWLS